MNAQFQRGQTPAKVQPQTQNGVLTTIQSDKMVQAIKQVLPNYITPERFVGMAVAAAKLFEKDPSVVKDSILLSVFDAAKLGLAIGGPEQHAHLVPFKSKSGKTIVQLITGYKGLIHLGRKNAGVEECSPYVVYKNDKFRMWNDENGKHFEHEPCLGERGDPIGCYVLTRKLGESTPDFHFTHIERVEKIEKGAMARGGAVWKTDREAMILKTAIRQGYKYKSLSPVIDAVVGKEERMEAGMIESVIPEEMKEVIDAGYAEVVEAVNAEANDNSTKPVVAPPKAKAQAQAQSTTNPVDSRTQEFLDAVREAAMEKGVADNIDAICFAEFGSVLAEVKSEDRENVLAHFLTLTPISGPRK